MPIDLLSSNHIGNMAGGFEPQRANHFIFECVPPGGSSNEAQIIRLAVETGFGPNESNEEIEIPYLNDKRYVAGSARFETGELTLRDFVDEAVANIIYNWRRKIYDPATGRIGLARQYKTVANIILFAPDGTYERVWELHGVWPTTVNWATTLDYNAGTDIVKITCTMRYDRAIAPRGLIAVA